MSTDSKTVNYEPIAKSDVPNGVRFYVAHDQRFLDIETAYGNITSGNHYHGAQYMRRLDKPLEIREYQYFRRVEEDAVARDRKPAKRRAMPKR